uniref:DNA-binding pseudobarrel domain-containing protein n=1 Tax=Tanacetum cinerariifolium TaxID=118510 RepID=A0A6L2L7T9_TANCI|nr:DNA-binding pseudobarrel domain-containing protein [Tanacetum cinerariifolium]
MEQYLALLRENQAPSVVKPEIRGNVNFESKSQFMRELKEDTFFKNKNEDAHDHVDRVLNIDPLKDGCIDSLQELSTLGTSLKKPLSKGLYLDKECPLNEEVKQMEEVKYGEFEPFTPFNESNGVKCHVGPSGYYTRTDNRPPYEEKRPSLEELMNKHQEESARRSTEMK